MPKEQFIAVIDFASQTTMLIARRIRELGVNAQVLPASITKAELECNMPMALILSGGPESLLDDDAIRMDPEIFDLNLPTLGICYGMQLLVSHFGGVITRAEKREFGKRALFIDNRSSLFRNISSALHVWMSHCDQVNLANTQFSSIARSDSCPHAAIAWENKKIYGVQFHPEVSHTDQGVEILSNFLFHVVDAPRNFSMEDFLKTSVDDIRQQVGDSHVIMGLSGGVDSSVAAVLIHRAIKDQLHCVYVNHGLHRLGEIEEVKNVFGQTLNIDLHIVDAREQFFTALAGIEDPEQKRKICGRVFVEVFEQEAKRYNNVAFLGQGTLYPDVIESQSKNPKHVIKSHHNVGGLPERMNLKLLEPLRDLFKDEVRKLGALLGLPDSVLMRQPFPGPGLAIRIPGALTQARVEMLQHADAIVREEIDREKLSGVLPENIWQWFAILLPVKSVGVMGDARSYGDTIVLRCVESLDAMTADWCKLPYELLGIISSRITNEVAGISRVLYDITQKPPGTIEWE